MGEGVHENPVTDHQRDSFKNSYPDSFYLLEEPVNNASEVLKYPRHNNGC